MDSSASVETHHDPHSHAGEHEHHELGWWRKYIFSTDHKVIGIQYGLCGLVIPVPRLLPDDVDALAAGLSWPGAAGDWQISPAHFRAGLDAGRENDARLLQLVRRDARHDHDLSRSRAAGVRSVWKFRRAAANRRAGHDLPESERWQVSGRSVLAA